jgi:hypothetical protein
VTIHHIDELIVPYDPSQLQLRVARRRRGMWSRLISLGITVVILVLLYFFGGDRLQGAGSLSVYGVVLAISLGWFVGYLVAWLRARRAARGVGTGTAVRIGRPGIQVGQVFTPWSEVSGLAMTGSRLGASPRFELRRSTGPAVSVPLDQIDVHPATLDSTARAYSGGRHGVDLSALDN